MPPMPPMGPKGPGGPGGPPGRHSSINGEKPKNGKKTLAKLLRYIGRSKYIFFALMAVMLIITGLNLAAPSIQQRAIDFITITEKRLNVDLGGLGRSLVLLGVVYAASSVFTYLQGILSAKLSQYTVKTMRRDLFAQV